MEGIDSGSSYPRYFMIISAEIESLPLMLTIPSRRLFNSLTFPGHWIIKQKLFCILCQADFLFVLPVTNVFSRIYWREAEYHFPADAKAEW